MTKHSDEGHLVHMKADEHLDNDDPLSIDVVRTLRNNLLHLHDMATLQHANICSMGTTDSVRFEKGNEAWELICSVPVRVIPRQDGAPADLLIRVTGLYSGSATSGTLQTNVVPFGASYGRDAAPRYATASGAIPSLHGTVINEQHTFAQGSEAHEQLFVSEHNGGALTAFPSYANSAGSDPGNVRLPMWRVDLWGICAGGETPTYVVYDFNVRSFIGS